MKYMQYERIFSNNVLMLLESHFVDTSSIVLGFAGYYEVQANAAPASISFLSAPPHRLFILSILHKSVIIIVAVSMFSHNYCAKNDVFYFHLPNVITKIMSHIYSYPNFM